MQSAVGGMTLSIFGMVLAAFGFLTPVGGAVSQEIIDLWAVLNALRASQLPETLRDFHCVENVTLKSNIAPPISSLPAGA